MEKRVSVIIPNYNGRELLAKNLPSVLANCLGCEIIVVDDASTDDSIQFLKKKYNKIRIVKNTNNLGFAKTANLGVQKANSRLVLLLNSDVSPRNNFLKVAIKHFENKNLFAVGIEDYSHESGKIITKGRGGIKFKKGFFLHFPAFIERGPTFWVSGGSGLFDRDKFLELGGFDDIYKPFYWEDIDLAFRAWKSGYTCIFEPLSKVDHFHEQGAIATQKSRFFIKIVSYKNQFIFAWKNISSYTWALEHLLWLPFNIFKAILNFDLAFIAGLAWALLDLPHLLYDQVFSENSYLLSDREVVNTYDK